MMHAPTQVRAVPDGRAAVGARLRPARDGPPAVQTALALQRAAGNRATTAVLAPVRSRLVARCGAGGCGCGGSCQRDEWLEDPLRPRGRA